MNTTEIQTWWDREFQPAPSDSGVDFVSRDGNLLIEVQIKPQGMRGFYAGVMRLALELESRPDAERGCLVIDASNLSFKRLQQDWEKAKRVLGKKYAKKLAIIAIQKDELWIEPKGDASINELASHVLSVPNLGFKLPENTRRIRATRKADEIIKVLVSQWLQELPSIGVGELGEIVGCSYPTIRKTVTQLEATKHLNRGSASTVHLAKFPESDWKRIVALATTNRNTMRFTDRSGQRPNMKKLLDRINRIKPNNVALGGVIAARHWDADFDLNGIPRLDLLIHEESQSLNLEFMNKLDPALKPSKDEGESSVVVIHTIGRANPGFSTSKKHALPIADPVETALDLIEMGLPAQAIQLLSHFRKEARYS